MTGTTNKRLIHDFTFSMIEPGCFPGAAFWKASAELADDITQALPYLNAELNGAEYDPGAQVLLWQNGNLRYAFRPRRIDIGPVDDREKGRRLADDIVEIVNEIWSRREEIEPDFEGRKPPPTVLDIYKLLPGTNCKECGYPTCFSFAAALREGNARTVQCPPLSREEHRERRRQLSSLLDEHGGEG